MRPELLICLILVIYCSHVSPAPLGGNLQPKSEIKMPAMARKAGGSWKPELTQTDDMPEREEKENPENGENDEEDYSYSYDDYEDDCGKGMFYHIRGRRCVPLRCAAGRDKDTGECNDDDGGYLSYRGRGTGWYRPYVYRSIRYPKKHRGFRFRGR